MKNFKLKLYFIVFIVFSSSLKTISQTKGTENTKKMFANEVTNILTKSKLELTNWLFKSGNNQAWAGVEFDDSNWKKIENTFPNIESKIIHNRKNTLWFRSHFAVDSLLLNKNISFNLRMRGAMEVYLNGNKIHSIGKVGRNHRIEKAKYTEIHPITLPLNNSKNYVLAIRYSNSEGKTLASAFSWTWAAFYTGFELEYLGENLSNIAYFRQSIINLVLVHYIIATLIFTIGLFHFFTFFFVKNRKIHLWFGLYVIAIAISSSLSIYVDVGLAHNPINFSGMLTVEFINMTLAYLVDLATIRCLYYFFYEKTPRIWLYFVAISVLSFFYIILFSNLPFASLIRTIFHIASLLEGIRVIIQTIRKKKKKPYVAQNIYVIIIGAFLAASFEITGVILNAIYGLNVFSSSLLFFIANMTIICIVGSMQIYIIRVDRQRERTIQHELEQVKKIEEQLALKEIEKELKIKFEKERIARDLHDNIGSQLTFLLKQIEKLQQNEEKDNDKIEELTRATIQELRNTVWVMKQDKISLEDLESKIYDFIWKLGDIHGLKIITQFDNHNADKIILTPEQATNTFRITQEALHNAIKYSKAEEILVKIQIKTPEKLIFLIEDNGKGFDKAKVEANNFHNGLLNMQARGEILGSTLSVDSILNQGTKIKFSLDI